MEWIGITRVIVVMISSNIEDLEYMKKELNPKGKGEIHMLSDYLPGQKGKEVPDAYYARGIRIYYV